MTKQEKIKSWLIEQGYQAHGDNELIYRIKGRSGLVCSHQCEVDRLFEDGDFLIGCVIDSKLLQVPDFRDDLPEPKDKALQEYIEAMQRMGHTYREIGANIETNNRIKDLEAAVARLEAANEKA